MTFTPQLEQSEGPGRAASRVGEVLQAEGRSRGRAGVRGRTEPQRVTLRRGQRADTGSGESLQRHFSRKWEKKHVKPLGIAQPTGERFREGYGECTGRMVG